MSFISSFAKTTVTVAAITMSVVPLPVVDGLKFRTVSSPLDKVKVLDHKHVYDHKRVAPVLHDKPVFKHIDLQTHANFANDVVALAARGCRFSAIIEKIDSHLQNVDTRLQTSIREIYKNSGALKLITGQKHFNPSVSRILSMLGVGIELQLSKEETFLTTETASKSRRFADFMAPARARGARGVRRPITMDVVKNPSPTVSDDGDSEESYEVVMNPTRTDFCLFKKKNDSENAASLQRDAVIGLNNVASRLRTQVAQAPAPVEDE